MNRLELRNRVISYVPDVKNRTDDLNTWINLVLQNMSIEYSYKEMVVLDKSITTVIGTKTYNFPAYYKLLKSCRLIDGTASRELEVRFLFESDTEDIYPESKSKSKPTKIIDNGDLTFDLIPIPDKAYLLWLRYDKYHSPLTDDTTEIQFKNKDMLIMSALMIECYSALSMPDEIALWMARYQEAFKNVTGLNSTMYNWKPKPKGLYTKSENKDKYWKIPFPSDN